MLSVAHCFRFDGGASEDVVQAGPKAQARQATTRAAAPVAENHAATAIGAHPVDAASSHRQAYVRRQVETALTRGHAPGLLLAGQCLAWREAYVAVRLQQDRALAATAAASEWNRLAAGHVAGQAGAGLDNHRERFIQSYADCVVQCGRAPGLIVAGKNSEDRLAWILAAAREGAGNDALIPAEQRWNWLAAEHASRVAVSVYARLHPLPSAGAACFDKRSDFPRGAVSSDGPVQFQAMEQAQILARISQASGPHRKAGDVAFSLSLETLGEDHRAHMNSAGPQPEMPHPSREYSEDNYALLQAIHRSLDQAFLQAFMYAAPEALLFRIYVDPRMQENRYDLQDMASKILFERRH